MPPRERNESLEVSVARLEEKLDAFTISTTEFRNCLGGKIGKQDERIVVLEKFRWTAMGVAGAISAFTSAIVAKVLGKQ